MHLFFTLLAKLPLGVLQALGSFFGTLTFRLSAPYRERTRENLETAGLVGDAYFGSVGRNAGRQAMESIWVWYRKPEDVLKRVTVDEPCRRLIEAAMQSGRPVVFLTPHVGCFEVLPVWFASHYWEKTGRNISILFRPPQKKILRRLVGEARQAPGIVACPTTIAGVKQVIRNLKNGHTFGALPDQVPSKGEGVWAPFFGREAYTMTLPARVAKQFDAVRLFVWGERTREGWTLHGREWNDELTGDLRHDCTMMNRVIEEIVLSCPTQYPWSYNRYKVPAGARPRPTSESET